MQTSLLLGIPPTLILFCFWNAFGRNFFSNILLSFFWDSTGIYILKDWANISFSPAPSDVPTEGKIYLQAITCVAHSKYTTCDLVDTIFAMREESSGDRHRNLHRVHCLH